MSTSHKINTFLTNIKAALAEHQLQLTFTEGEFSIAPAEGVKPAEPVDSDEWLHKLKAMANTMGISFSALKGTMFVAELGTDSYIMIPKSPLSEW